MTNVKSLLALYVKMGGSLTDTYSDIAGGIPVGQYSLISDAVLACSKKYSSGGGLPADFPAEGIANADKFLGFDNSGDYAALDAPSGAEKFVVTLTDDDSGGEDVRTADKTIAEIVEADSNGAYIVAAAEIAPGMFVEVPLILSMLNEATGGAMFAGIITLDGSSLIFRTIIGMTQSNEDSWQINDADYAPLPSYSSSNNGQVLGVSSGSLAWVAHNAPLIVTMTAGQTEGTFVGDKTYSEVNAAYSSGANCVLYLNAGAGGVIRASVVSSLSINNNIAVYAYLFDSFKEIVGAPDEFITFNLGN